MLQTIIIMLNISKERKLLYLYVCLNQLFFSILILAYFSHWKKRTFRNDNEAKDWTVGTFYVFFLSIHIFFVISTIIINLFDTFCSSHMSDYSMELILMMIIIIPQFMTYQLWFCDNNNKLWLCDEIKLCNIHLETEAVVAIQGQFSFFIFYEPLIKITFQSMKIMKELIVY